MRRKKKREYLRLLDKAIDAMRAAIDSFNRVGNPHKTETCLMLMTNGWELLSKAVLVKHKVDIVKDKLGNTLAAEVAVAKLRGLGLLDENQEDCIQQVISLRHCACHNALPDIPEEIIHHLFYFGCKFFRDITGKVFPTHLSQLQGNFLCIAFSELTTYADKVHKLVSKFKRDAEGRRLVWLLERGILFEGTTYVSQDQFETEYRKKRSVLPHLGIGKFMKTTDMVRIVAVQAPKNYTADITLRKGSKADNTLPVLVKKTDVESDYPYLTTEVGDKVGKDASFIAATVKYLKLKGDRKYHQPVRASRSGGVIHRYSDAALTGIQQFLAQHPDFNPYKENRAEAKH